MRTYFHTISKCIRNFVDVHRFKFLRSVSSEYGDITVNYNNHLVVVVVVVVVLFSFFFFCGAKYSQTYVIILTHATSSLMLKTRWHKLRYIIIYCARRFKVFAMHDVHRCPSITAFLKPKLFGLNNIFE